MKKGCRTGVLHAIVSHGTTSMAGVEDPAKNLGGLIRHVDSGRNVLHLDVPSTLPFLDSKVLNVDVTGTRSGLPTVDHVNGSLVVFMKNGGALLLKSKFLEDHSKVLGNLGSMNCSNKLSLSAGSSNNSLEFALVGNGATGKAEDETSNRSSSLDAVGQGRVNKSNQLHEFHGRKWRQRGVPIKLLKWNSGQSFKGIRTPIDDAPMLSSSKVLADLLEGKIVGFIRCSSKPTKESHSIANVGSAEYIGINKFPKELAVRETNLFLEFLVGSSLFFRTDKLLQLVMGQ